MKRLRQAGRQRHLAQKSYSPPCLVPSSLFAPLFFSKIFDVCVDGKLVRVGGVKEVDHDLTSNDLILIKHESIIIIIINYFVYGNLPVGIPEGVSCEDKQWRVQMTLRG